jgi:hypothetical protein
VPDTWDELARKEYAKPEEPISGAGFRFEQTWHRSPPHSRPFLPRSGDGWSMRRPATRSSWSESSSRLRSAACCT